MKYLLLIFILSACAGQQTDRLLSKNETLTESITDTETYIYGVTVDDISPLLEITDSLKAFRKKMTTRIVFDQGQPPRYYKNSVQKISEVSFVMGQILDSSAMKKYSVQAFKERTDDYLYHFPVEIDIWEIGNEVNGEWLGSNAETLQKIKYALQKVKQKKQKAALTLYYNPDCFENKNNEMFNWVQHNISSEMKKSLDYVFISYYEDDCNNFKPNWLEVFKRLKKIFPKSKLGFGEVGTKNQKLKANLIKEYYSKKIPIENFIGGYFWWYFNDDMIPSGRPHWKLLNDLL